MKYIDRSLQLDKEFLQVPLPLTTKIDFIVKKYVTIMRNITRGYTAGKSSVTIFRSKYFYDDPYGLAILQGTFADNAFLTRIIPPHGVVIDVGANIGQFNLFAKECLRAKRIYSFEPVTMSYDLLKKNGVGKKLHFAVSSKKKVKIYLSGFSVWASSLPASTNAPFEEVKGISLHEIPLLVKEPVVDLLKIDVEGTELDTLRVSKKILKKSKYLLVESSIMRTATGDISALFIELQKIAPEMKLVKIGRVYDDNGHGVTGAADLLFANQNLITI